MKKTNSDLIKNWGSELYSRVGDRLLEESTSTVLNIANIFENQLNEAKTDSAYTNEHLVAYFGGGVDRVTGNLLESFNMLHKRGKLAGLSRDEVVQLTENIAKQNTALSDSQVEKIITEGVVVGDSSYDPIKIASGEMSGNIVNAGPAVLGMVKRAVPKLIALDICGTQTMSQPQGQYFGIRSVYGNENLGDPKQGFDPNGKEMFHPELGPDIMQSATDASRVFESIEHSKALDNGDIYKFVFQFADGEDREDPKYATLREVGESGLAYFQVNKDGGLTVPDAVTQPDLIDWVLKQSELGTLFETGPAMATSLAELMEGYNKSTNNEWQTVSFRIDKNVHEAKERKLKATTSVEAIQDLQAFLGMDVVSMLQSMIVDEIALEINREVITWVNASAELGKDGRTRTPNSRRYVFDLFDAIDNRGARTSAESAKALLYQIDKEANEILKRTGRGRGNVILASPGVVTLIASIPESITDARIGFATGKNLDFAQSTYAGTINGMRTHLDQFARYEYFTIGYRGSQPIDAGLIFAPYILLTPKMGQDYRNFSPVIGYLSRYALAVNPMVNARIERPKHRINNGMPSADVIRKNSYFRHVKVINV